MNLDDAEDEKIVQEADRSINALSDAIDWAEQIVEEVAQTQRIKDILDFVNQRKDFLVQYTGQNIYTSLNQMSDNAKDMAGQMKAIKNLSLKLKD